MKIGVYFCDCGTIIKEKIDYSVITKGISIPNHEIVFHTFGFMCSDTGKKEVEETLRKEPVDRLVVAACSPRDHEQTFMKIMLKTGMNPFFLAMVNMREQVAWVTTDPEKATQKGLRYVRAAIQRSILQEPLEKREIEISPNAIVIGGGPAGLSAALSLAEAGRKVVVIEKSAAIGGLPVRYEEVFPRMECGPCLLEPMMDEVLHGPTHENIELFTLATLCMENPFDRKYA